MDLIFIALIEITFIEILALLIILVFSRRKKQFKDTPDISHKKELLENSPINIQVKHINEQYSPTKKEKNQNRNFLSWIKNIFFRIVHKIKLNLSRKTLSKSTISTKAVKKIRAKEQPFQFKKLKPEQYIISLIYLTVFVFLAYLIVGHFLIDKFQQIEQKEYIINAESVKLLDNLNGFYLDGNSLGDKVQINNLTVRPITTLSAFNAILNPKTIIPSGAEVEIELKGINNGTSLYLNEKPIVPNLMDYKKVADFENDSVYIKNEILNENNRDLISGLSAEDLIYKNFPYSNSYSFKEGSNYVPNIENYSSVWTNIGPTIRNHLKLAVYAEGHLEITFTKQDLNINIGKDEYTVTVSDFNGKEYYKNLFGDDGDASDDGNLNRGQKFDINLDNLPNGIYYISFVRDNNNKWEDSSLEDVRVNSNKILIVDKILPWTSFSLYTKNVNTEELLFKSYWINNKTIYINGPTRNKIILEKTGEEGGMKIDEIGEYTISDYGGNGQVWINNPFYLSPTKDTWFDIPLKSSSKFVNQDLIIVDKNKLNLTNTMFTYKSKIYLNRDFKINLQVLDSNKLYLNQVKVIIK